MAKEASNQSAKRPAAGAKGKKKVFLHTIFTLHNYYFFIVANYCRNVQKWSKGKTNDRLDNAVLFEKSAYDAAVKGIPALKLITTATVSDKFKVFLLATTFLWNSTTEHVPPFFFAALTLY